MDLIIPDMAATEDLDAVRLLLEYQVREAEVLLDIIDEDELLEHARQAAREAQERLDAYTPPESPATITIGYLPARKRRELVTRRTTVLRGKQRDDYLSDDEQILLDDLRMEWLRWGVRGHAHLDPVEWRTDQVDYQGRQHQAVHPETLDAYETMGLLRPLADAIERFNTLSAQKKTRSSPTSSGDRVTSTAGPVSETPD